MVEIRNISGQQSRVQYTVAPMPSFSVQSRQRQLIPADFVQLQSRRRNNIGSAEEFDEKSGYERYYFFHENKGYRLDISFELLEQLGLVRGQNCEHTIYVSNEVLNRNEDRGGITVDNLEDIILVRPGTILEREVQTDLTGQEVSDLESNSTEQARNIQELNERANILQEEKTQLEANQERLNREKDELTEKIRAREARINELTTQNEETETQFRREKTELEEERNRLRNELNNLRIRLNEVNNTLNNLNQQNNNLQTNLTNARTAHQTAERQRRQIQQELQTRTTERDEARRNLQNEQNTHQQTQNQLADANDNINDLTNQRNGLWAIINNAQAVLGIDDLNNLPALPHGENLNSLLIRPTQQQLQDEQTIRQNTEQHLEQTRQELDETRTNLTNEQERLLRENNQLVEEKERIKQEKQEIRTRLDLVNETKKRLLKKLDIYQKCSFLEWEYNGTDEEIKEVLLNHPQSLQFLYLNNGGHLLTPDILSRHPLLMQRINSFWATNATLNPSSAYREYNLLNNSMIHFNKNCNKLFIMDNLH